MRKSEKPMGVQTIAIHAGEEPDAITGASAPNIVLSTTFLADPDASFSVEGMKEDASFVYTRWGNPTVRQLEQKLAALEEAEAGVAFGSGMAAISGLFFHLLGKGDHLVMSDVAYAAASELTATLLPRLGIKVTKVDTADVGAVKSAVSSKTRLVYVETPCNPLLRLTDIGAVSKIAKDAGAKLAVDSTFATPIATQPLKLGADYVIHSLSKYLGGHGDAIGGSILGSANDLALLRKNVAIRTGGILSPFNAWLVMRGIATLPIRMRAHSEGAQQVAEFLESHPKVTRVIYPGLASHPGHALALRQMKLFSGMLTFQVKDGGAAAKVFARRLRVIHYAVSLGHHRSLIFYLPTDELLATSFKLNHNQAMSYRAYAGDGIFRFSTGLEDAADLIDDLDQCLKKVK